MMPEEPLLRLWAPPTHPTRTAQVWLIYPSRVLFEPSCLMPPMEDGMTGKLTVPGEGASWLGQGRCKQGEKTTPESAAVYPLASA